MIIINSKRKILMLICLLALSMLMFGCNNGNQNQIKQQNKFGAIDKNNITSFIIRNRTMEEKEIKNKTDRNKIIDLINSVHITKSGIDELAGDGFGVIITYSNGEKFTAGFLADSVAYSFGEKTIWCNIDKNIIDNLSNYYYKK